MSSLCICAWCVCVCVCIPINFIFLFLRKNLIIWLKQDSKWSFFCKVSHHQSESESCSVVSNPLRPHRLYRSWNSLGQNTGVGSLSLLQGIFPTQGSNPGLPHCRWILYQMSYKGNPRILERVAYPFSNRSSGPRNQTWVFCIAGRFFTNWAILEAQTEV